MVSQGRQMPATPHPRRNPSAVQPLPVLDFFDRFSSDDACLDHVMEMCLIIDACTFHAVFNPRNANYSQYEAVRDWIENKKGKMIVRGTQYCQELVGRRFLSVLGDYERRRRLVKLPTRRVDELADRLKKLEKHKDFDDPHLIAMAIIAKYRVYMHE